MTRDQFISWLKGFTAAVEEIPTKGQWETIVSELNKIQECTDWGSPIGEGGWGVPNTNPFPKIDPKPHPFTPYKPTPNPYTGGKEGKVMYGDICSCNPKNGGSGICHCIMAHELVDPNTQQGIASTDITISNPNIFPKWQEPHYPNPWDKYKITYDGTGINNAIPVNGNTNITTKLPPNSTLNYTIKDDSKDS